MSLTKYSEALARLATTQLTQLTKKLTPLTNLVDEILGTSEVRKYQNDVKTSEVEFTMLRSKIENVKIKIQNSSTSIDDIRRLLDRSDRTSNDYLKHLTEERSLLIEHRKLMNALEEAESQERSCFNKYSLAVRNFYEMERVQNDQMRFYSICFSVFCTILGGWIFSICGCLDLKLFGFWVSNLCAFPYLIEIFQLIFFCIFN